MDSNKRQILESEGLQVVEVLWDAKYKTKFFIKHPDGRLNPYYERIDLIPQLPNGTEFDLDREAMPYDEIYGRPSDVVNANGIVHAGYEYGLVPPIWVGYFLISLVMLAIVICFYFIINPPAQEPPCGTSTQIIDVSECAKIIIMPNCDSRLYDACADEWLEDQWHTWEPPAGWITWIVIGVIAIGAIVIIPPLLRSFRKPPAQKPPGIKYIE